MKHAINYEIRNLIENLEKNNASQVRAAYHELNGMLYGFFSANLMTLDEYLEFVKVVDMIRVELNEKDFYVFA